MFWFCFVSFLQSPIQLKNDENHKSLHLHAGIPFVQVNGSLVEDHPTGNPLHVGGLTVKIVDLYIL